MKTLIISGGFLWLALFVFHVLFWKLFDWKHDLNSLTAVNKAIIQVLNLCLMLCFLLFAYVSFFHTDELLTTGLGKALLTGMMLFGVFRTIEQIIFFDLKHPASRAFLLVILTGTTLYLISLISIIQN